MPENPTYNLSQDLEIIPPKKGKVYPIPVSDWDLTKSKIENIKFKTNWLTNIGFVLIGGGLSFLGTNLATEFKESNYEVVCWGLFAICSICGIAFIIFGELRRQDNSMRTDQVISDMEAIEQRYKPDE